MMKISKNVWTTKVSSATEGRCKLIRESYCHEKSLIDNNSKLCVLTMEAASLSESAYSRLSCNELHYISGLPLTGRGCKSAEQRLYVASANGAVKRPPPTFNNY